MKTVVKREPPPDIADMRAVCARRRIRVGDLARRLGTSHAYVSGVLQGRKAVSHRQLDRIQHAINELTPEDPAIP